MATLPAGIGTGMLTANIFEILGDTADTDRDPDTGAITDLKLHIRADAVAIGFSAVNKTGIPKPETYTFNANFDLVDKVNAVGVRLVATDNQTSGTGFTYTATLEAPPSYNIPRIEWTFELLTGQTLDLARVQAIMPKTGARLIRGESAYEIALANGFVGSEAQWLASLNGAPGAASFARPGVYSGDLNMLLGPENAGAWYIAASVTNKPSATGSGVGGTLILAAPHNDVASQYFAEHPSNSNAVTIWGRAYTATFGWSPWNRLNINDTGWRDISAGLLNGWTSNSGAVGVAVRRINDTVYLRTRSLNSASATASQFYIMPSGFIPAGADGGLTMFNSGVIRQVSILTNGTTNISGYQSTDGPGVSMSISYLTNNAWPTTLPGTPV